MNEPIKGKISNIIDPYTVTLNIGKNQKVSTGMLFRIIAKVIDVKDPDSGDILGKIEIEKDQIIITRVHEKFSEAETIGTVKEPIGPTFSFSKFVQKRLSGNVSAEVDKTVKVGDEVVQIVNQQPPSSN